MAPRSPPARTFGFREDEKHAARYGADPWCVRGERYHSHAHGEVQNGRLRFDDEFVRHKVLDLIGDLALAGHRILGRVVAQRAGHAMHTALVSRLLRDRSAWELVQLCRSWKPRAPCVPVAAAPSR